MPYLFHNRHVAYITIASVILTFFAWSKIPLFAKFSAQYEVEQIILYASSLTFVTAPKYALPNAEIASQKP